MEAFLFLSFLVHKLLIRLLLNGVRGRDELNVLGFITCGVLTGCPQFLGSSCCLISPQSGFGGSYKLRRSLCSFIVFHTESSNAVHHWLPHSAPSPDLGWGLPCVSCWPSTCPELGLIFALCRHVATWWHWVTWLSGHGGEVSMVGLCDLRGVFLTFLWDAVSIVFSRIIQNVWASSSSVEFGLKQAQNRNPFCVPTVLIFNIFHSCFN